MRKFYSAQPAQSKTETFLTLEDAAAALGIDGNPRRVSYGVGRRYTPGGHEVIGGSRKWFLAHVALPYGEWTCADGREVLHNRFYEPIWQRADGVLSRADPSEWVRNIVEEQWLYNNASAPWRSAADAARLLRILEDFGVDGRPSAIIYQFRGRRP
jgi:hypothetical protein